MWMDGWFAEGKGEPLGVHRTPIGTGGGGGGVGEDGRTVMKTAAARAVTGRHDRKTDASGNPI